MPVLAAAKIRLRGKDEPYTLSSRCKPQAVLLYVIMVRATSALTQLQELLNLSSAFEYAPKTQKKKKIFTCFGQSTRLITCSKA